MLPSILRSHFNFSRVLLDMFLHVDGRESLKQSLIAIFRSSTVLSWS